MKKAPEGANFFLKIVFTFDMHEAIPFFQKLTTLVVGSNHEAQLIGLVFLFTRFTRTQIAHDIDHIPLIHFFILRSCLLFVVDTLILSHISENTRS
jgi:hypothetical protein